jgi:predicted ATPase
MANHLNSITLLTEKYPDCQQYPFTLPIFQRTRHLRFDSPVTLFVGENGSGKSTLLEALARACGIHIWSTPAGDRCQVNPYEDQLYNYLSVEWSDGHVPGSFFGAEIFKDFTHYLDAWAAADPGLLKYFGGESLLTKSHGQSLMSFFRSRYRIEGLYLLDEPETALSPRSQLELIQILEENGQAGHAQFIIATHSPILLSCPEARLYSFDHIPVKPVIFEDTQHYQIYRNFLLDRGKQ